MSDENRDWYFSQPEDVQREFRRAAVNCAAALGYPNGPEGGIAYWLDALIGVARTFERSVVSP